MTDGLLEGSNWWRGRSAGYLKKSFTGSAPDPELHYTGRYDYRDQSTIWYDALRAWQLHAAIAAGEARLAARFEAAARYREQRRQAVAAIVGGLLIMILVVVVAAWW